MEKYIHIMPNEKFITPYIEFIKNNFNFEEHKFYLINGESEKKFKIPIYKNVYFYKSNKNNNFILIMDLIKLWIMLYKNLNKSKYLYFHSLFDKRIILFLFIFRKFLKKSNWVIWGGDLYCYKKRKSSFKYSIWYKIEDYVKRNFAYISTLVPEDYEVAKKYYKVKGKNQMAIYPVDFDIEFFNSLSIELKNDTYIQVGNSADPSNNHFEILDILSRYRNENIRIFCILSYGDREYAKKVNEYGKKIFKEKFTGIFDYMAFKEYCNYLKKIDILVFNHKRQQGLGNIFILSYLEKKIYMRNDISSWNYLTQDLGLILNSYENIRDESFKKFIRNDSKGNKKKLSETYFSEKYVSKVWKKNFQN